jgi:hypothetical protein
MFKLSDTERGRITAAAARLEGPAATLLTAMGAYNKALGELREIVRSIETGWQTAWDKHSERWQDSATGQSVADTITAWASLVYELEDIEVALPEIAIPD